MLWSVVAEIGKQGGLIQYDWVSLNSLFYCSRMKTADGSSNNDTNLIGSNPIPHEAT